MDKLTLKQQISQMFTAGFQGASPDLCFEKFLKQGLGGVIFFTHNILEKNQFKNLIKELSKKAALPLFFSIDQEGGRVERTENIYGGKKYLSAKFAYQKGLDFLARQSAQIALELKNFGINMNFAPVLDVNTNINNPIIGERAYSDNPDDVIQAAEIVSAEYKKYGIIAVCKHFPGHGAADADSHTSLPVIPLSLEELEKVHIKPFKAVLNMPAPAVMAAHVLYPALDKYFPASISEKIINNLLIKQLGFKGLIITDDMEMNGIKGFTKLDACIKAVNAGVNMFIFRKAGQELLELTESLEKAVYDNIIDYEKIRISSEKILKLKKEYGII